MLDTNICSFIIREKPQSVLHRLQEAVQARSRLVISAITYAELLYGANSKKASPRMVHIVREFIERMDEVLPWDRDAVEQAATLKKTLEALGTPIGPNDTAIAGHALSQHCILVTNNLSEFSRVPGLNVQDWVQGNQ
ncbi:MAG TPA: type II toxin-antitoxin system VapC family toxin [Limnobacter sp.]|uniref:type II toxin-antitoxin system VapC family toxin n=1 Tax=Limnobacter sp. TaxID=2003368 RepID=UPI002ED97730